MEDGRPRCGKMLPCFHSCEQRAGSSHSCACYRKLTLYPACGHPVFGDCSDRPKFSNHQCLVQCGKVLQCGHSCKKACADSCGCVECGNDDTVTDASVTEFEKTLESAADVPTTVFPSSRGRTRYNSGAATRAAIGRGSTTGSSSSSQAHATATLTSLGKVSYSGSGTGSLAGAQAQPPVSKVANPTQLQINNGPVTVSKAQPSATCTNTRVGDRSDPRPQQQQLSRHTMQQQQFARHPVQRHQLPRHPMQRHQLPRHPMQRQQEQQHLPRHPVQQQVSKFHPPSTWNGLLPWYILPQLNLLLPKDAFQQHNSNNGEDTYVFRLCAQQHLFQKWLVSCPQCNGPYQGPTITLYSANGGREEVNVIINPEENEFAENAWKEGFAKCTRGHFYLATNPCCDVCGEPSLLIPGDSDDQVE